MTIDEDDKAREEEGKEEGFGKEDSYRYRNRGKEKVRDGRNTRGRGEWR